ncbi:MAG: sugar transferase [Clostridiales bacterium]|nr:sugar transferase [Clostridiales bacterium]
MSRRSFIALALVFDALFVNVGIAAAFFVRFGGIPPAFNFNAYLGLAPVITLVYLGACYIYGLYEPERTEGAWSIFRSVFMAVTLGAILTAAIAFLAGPRFFSFSRFAIALGWLFDIVLLVGWRLAFMAVTQIRWPEQRVLVVGTGKVARELARELAKRSRWGVRVVGFLSAGAEEGSDAPDTPDKRTESSGLAEIDGLPLLGGPSEAGAVAAAHGVHRIIIVSPVELRDVIERLVIVDEIDVRVDVVPELYEVFIGTLDGVVADIPLMEITRTGRPRWYGAFKRVVDAVFAFALLVALSPPLIVIAIAITISMGWPVLYVQERVGAQGRPFRLYKFRTMIRDAESASGPVLASTGDARITPFGRFLRTYRIDELPQLVNILKGEMSFVGPRPERQYFVERHIAEIPGYRERFKIQPGVTGLAQVSGDYATTPERKLKYDLIYMYHQNLIMDLQIIAETIRVVLTGKGAR